MGRIGDGDRTAFKMLVDRHLRNFVVFASRIIGDRGEAEDIIQEAFLRVLKSASNWDQERNTRFTTWFYRVVMNLCIDVKRKQKPATTLEDAFDVIDDDPLPDVSLSDKQKAQKLADTLDQLPDRQRLAMTLCYMQELGNREAAEIMDVSVSALESLLVRGRMKMYEMLQEQQDELLKEKM